MKYYPINLDIRAKKVLVIGAGEVAHQKIDGLLQAGAHVYVIAIQACEKVLRLSSDHQIHLELREYQKEDLEGAVLVFAATNHPEVNKKIHQDAQEFKIIFNAVDQPSECDFIIPARVSRGDLLITISSGGKAPFLSKLLRKYFEKKFSSEWDSFVLKLGVFREKMTTQGRSQEFGAFFDLNAEEVAELLMKENWEKLQSLIESKFNTSF